MTTLSNVDDVLLGTGKCLNRADAVDPPRLRVNLPREVGPTFELKVVSGHLESPLGLPLQRMKAPGALMLCYCNVLRSGLPNEVASLATVDVILPDHQLLAKLLWVSSYLSNHLLQGCHYRVPLTSDHLPLTRLSGALVIRPVIRRQPRRLSASHHWSADTYP